MSELFLPSNLNLSRITRHLLASSANFFTQAMNGYGAQMALPFYLNAGIALEHLLKAQLAHVHPTLLAEPKDFKSMLILAKLPASDLPPPTIRSLSYQDALKRILEQFPSIAFHGGAD